LLAGNPQWPAAQELSDLDALVVAHNAGEGTVARYPAIPAITRDYLDRMRERTGSWAEPGSAPGCATPGSPTQVVVAPGTPHDASRAVRTAMSFVGVTSGWYNLCDKLACRIYGYANSGYDTAMCTGRPWWPRATLTLVIGALQSGRSSSGAPRTPPAMSRRSSRATRAAGSTTSRWSRTGPEVGST
jgi:hypothetical protein